MFSLSQVMNFMWKLHFTLVRREAYFFYLKDIKCKTANIFLDDFQAI